MILPANEGTKMEPTISYQFVTSLYESVSENPDVVDEAMRRFGLSDLDSHTSRVPLRPYIALFEWLAAQLKNPWLGLQLSAQAGPETLGAIGYMFLGSPNLEVAIRNLGNYLLAVQDRSQLYLGLDGEYAFVHYEILDDRITHRRQDSEYSIGYVWHLMQLLSANSCRLTMVEFEHERPEDGEGPYRRIFDAPTLFRRPFNRLHFRVEQLDTRSRTGDPNLYPILEAQIRDVVARAQEITSFVQQVRAQLTPDALAEGLRAKTIASHLGISVATLHRRLRAENTSFKSLLDERAKSHAGYLISQKTLSVATIARRLGYAETACLTRAFYRWFGMSPRQYRSSLEFRA